MAKVKDLTGKRFGRLVVIELAGKSANGKYQWKCKCDCGNYIIVKGNSLTTGHTKSCGCLEKETKRVVNTVHGLRKRPLYKVWLNMKDRCYNPNNSHFKYYGGKGIIVCNEWKNDFKTFYDWMSSNGYKEGMSIDRINNSLGYSPSNCRVIPFREQSSNRTTNYSIMYEGHFYTVAELSKLLNVKSSTLYSKLRRHGRI